MKRSKKGISLAFVIVVVMALLIFSAMLFSAASHSMSMTGESTDGRQAYLTAKSAVEYAKSVAYDQAKAGALKPFAVSHGSDGTFTDVPNIDPNLGIYKNLDGTTNYAICTNLGGDGTSWKITAKVKYRNSTQYRQLAYTFTLTQNNAVVNLPSADFLACGVNYGSHTVCQNTGRDWAPSFFTTKDAKDPTKGSSIYPVVENMTTYAYQDPTDKKLNDYVKAPEILFMGPTDSSHDTISCYNVSTEIHSDFIAVADNISGLAYWQNDRSFLYLYPTDSAALTGVIYFGGRSGGACSVNVNGNMVLKIPSGYYRFDAGIDLFSLKMAGDGFANTDGKGLRKLTQAEQQDEKIRYFATDISFAQSNAPALLSGDSWSDRSHKTAFRGADIAPYGVFASGSRNVKRGNDWYGNDTKYNMNEKDVFTYATSISWPSSSTWPLYLDPYGNTIDRNDGTQPNAKKYLIYAAKQFFLRFVNPVDNFELPPMSAAYNVVFNSDLVSLSMVPSDTEAGANASSRPKIVQASNSSSQFVLTSLSTNESGGHKNVTLAIPNDIMVSYQNNSKSYIILKGVYQVPSGFNFFDSKVTDWGSFWSNCKTGDYPVSGSGGSGGSGAFTITPGKYTGS